MTDPVRQETYDVVIVGGGVAGSTMGSVLARDGLNVLVLERETVFRDRVRGEWIAPWGVLELDALGLRHVAEAVPHANFVTNLIGYDDTKAPADAERDGLSMSERIPGGGCLTLGHPELQEAMLHNAGDEGATVHRGVQTVDVAPGKRPVVRFEHEGRLVDAVCRLVVAADGRRSPIREQLGIELHSTTPRYMMAGMLVEDAHAWPADRQAVGVQDDFHFLIFPQTGGRVRVYGAWDASDPHRFSGPGREERFLEAFRCDCLPEPGAIADGTPAGPLAGYPMTDAWTDTVARDGIVLIGDAAGWSDPLIGQGISVCLRDVHIASDVIRRTDDWSAGGFASYSDERRERMRRLRIASAGAYLRHNLGPDGPSTRRRVSAALAEDPMANPSLSAFLGAWVQPESVFPEDAWDTLLAGSSR